MTSHLRDEILKGRWAGLMPGRDRLAKELGVNGSTIERALVQLEQEEILKSQGVGKKRRIIATTKPTSPRILIVLYEPEDKLNHYIYELRRQLLKAGHVTTLAPRTLLELKYDANRVGAMIETVSADAVIIQSAARSILEKLSQSSRPTFALFGRMTDLPMAGSGPDKLPALRETIRHLCLQNQQRIVMIVREEALNPSLGAIPSVFLEELKKHNLPVSAYNLPNWKNSPEGFRTCLEKLFQVTPPTVILVDDWMLFFALQNYLAHEHGPAFRPVHCICTDYHPSFNWCQPSISHFQWDPLDVVKRAVSWVNNVGNGIEDREQKLCKAKFIRGGKQP